MRILAASVAVVAVLSGTTACGSGGFPAIPAAEAAHLHAYDISADSMAKTLQPGDVVAANDAVKVRRGSIIVFRGTPSWTVPGRPDTKFVKRVIAIGGDHLMCCDANGSIVLNGHPLIEPYLFPGVKPSTLPFDVTVAPERLFVMGDNRDFSADSRTHMIDDGGTIPVVNVVGVVTRIVKPPKRVRLIPTHT